MDDYSKISIIFGAIFILYALILIFVSKNTWNRIRKKFFNNTFASIFFGGFNIFIHDITLGKTRKNFIGIAALIVGLLFLGTGILKMIE